MDRIFSWLVLFGLLILAPAVTLPKHPKFLVFVGWPVWLFTYLGLLARNYKKKVPIPMGVLGWVEYEKRPLLYISAYSLMLLVCGFASLVLLVIRFAPR